MNSARIVFFTLLLAGPLKVSGQAPAPGAPTGLLCELLSNPQLSVITDAVPEFSWIVGSSRPGDCQTAYQLLLSSTRENAGQQRGDIWDSGVRKSGQSVNVAYAGKPLQPGSSYFWQVRTWNSENKASAWSGVQQINTGDFGATRAWPGESKWIRLTNEAGKPFWGFENRHPIGYREVAPVTVVRHKNGAYFVDFGRAAFAALTLTFTWQPQGSQVADTLTVHVGEKSTGQAIDQNPGGGVIFRSYPLPIQKGTHTYTLEIPRFVPKYPHSQAMPAHMPEVIPFRFCELETGDLHLQVEKITQLALYYQHDPEASAFSSASPDLNAIYELCKYSTIANTFNGDYASSERERMMYEADAYIQQLCHYAVDREFAIARYSTENLMYHATWPTEWISHTILMAHADYMHTGNAELLTNHYEALKAKTMLALRNSNGLISTRTGKQTPEFLKSIHYNGKELRDITDWPHGGMGLVSTNGETDNFVFTDYNTVVNAFHYRSLVLMADIAGAVGKEEDVKFYRWQAGQVKAAFNRHFLDGQRGLYTDGIGTDHASIHANMFSLAFGLVPPAHEPTVIGYIKSKGMACGVYGANYLLEALYDHGEEDYAYSLLTSDSDRSWLNMIRLGATMTIEAWDNKYKSNNSWSHAWSASPAHIIPRKLMGIEPALPGYERIRIMPRPGGLGAARVKVPTIRGSIEAGYVHRKGKLFELDVTLPANTSAAVYLPRVAGTYQLLVDGKRQQGKPVGKYILIDNVGSGKHHFRMTGH